jgi:transposase
MEILHCRCAGIDVHKVTVQVSVLLLVEGEILRHSRRFGTTTGELLALADWLASHGVTHVAMESTGVYWKPVYHLLEGRFQLLLVNAQHIKRVPGRKTDVKDAEWIAQLLQHGLLSPSFVPPPAIRDLRDLTRQRTQLVRERAMVVNRIHKVLEDAHIKLACVVSDILGKSGRDMIAAMIAGETDPDPLAELARGSLKKKKPALRQALHGQIRDHHRFLLRTLLKQEEHLEGQIAQYSVRIDEVMRPFAQATTRLRQIPGIGSQAAEVIVAEIGTDMDRFPTAGHLASWAGLCPGNHESAGKRQSGRTTKGSQWLRTMLVQVAWAATHTKQTRFRAAYRRWVKRMGSKKALVAVAHKILTVIYALLKNQTDYREQGVPEAA